MYAHFPATASPVCPEPPVRIIPGRLPATVPPPEHNAAVEHPPEVQLKVIVLRSRCAVALGVDTQHEVVAPLRSGVRRPGGDEDRVDRSKEPHLRSPLTSEDADLRRT